MPPCAASANPLCRSSPGTGRDLGGHALYRSPAGDETGSCAVSNLSCVKASPLQNPDRHPAMESRPGRFRWDVGPQGCLDRSPEGAGRACGGFSLAERGVQGCCVLTPVHMGRLRRWLGRPLPALAGASGRSRPARARAHPGGRRDFTGSPWRGLSQGTFSGELVAAAPPRAPCQARGR